VAHALICSDVPCLLSQWLRDSTDAPEVLKSAAHAMKHSEARQASSDYDAESDDRLVKAAFDFNISFASQYVADASGAAASSSSAAASAPLPPPPLPPLPEGPLDDAAIAARLVLLHCEWVGADQSEQSTTCCP
jgi:hypothetical protein